MTFTTVQIREMKGKQKFSMIAVYDYSFARIFDEAGIDILFIGDSLGRWVLGHPSAITVTMADMIHHTRAVARGAKRALVISDLPFMSYQASDEDAVRNAGALIQAGANAVKLEGGISMTSRIRAIVDSGIPVMGHVGMTPQTVNALGGFSVQGKTVESRRSVMEDALAVENAGAFAVCLDCVTRILAEEITHKLEVPTVGIGSGPVCDGQITIIVNFLGIAASQLPLKTYADVRGLASKAVQQFIRDIREGNYPDDEPADG